MKCEKFIVLGEKKNGRFYKSEEYNLKEFEKVLRRALPLPYVRPMSLWNFVSGAYYKDKKYRDSFIDFKEEFIEALLYEFCWVIESDKPGKRVK